MAQGKLKVKAKLPEGAKKNKQSKGSAVSKRANCPIKPKKKRFEEAHKLKQIITKTVNKAVEDEMRARATDGKTKLSKIQEAVASYNSASTSS